MIHNSILEKSFEFNSTAKEARIAMEAETIKNAASPKSHTIRRNILQKALLFFAVFCISTTSLFAQDIILKTDGSEIKAKVLEIITDQQIKYKDFDFQNGPVRNINITEVFMITYEGGKKEVFNKQTSTQTPMQTSTQASTQTSTPSPDLRLKNEFYLIGNNDNAMLVFFKENNSMEYYNDFESACRLGTSGKTLLGVGLGLTGLGVTLCIMGVYGINYDALVAGSVLTGVGHTLTIIGIPISAVAGGRKRKIKNDFARKKFGIGGYTYQPTLNFGVTGNGFGVTLKF